MVEIWHVVQEKVMEMWNEKFWLEKLTYKPAALEIVLQNKTCNLNAKGFTQKKAGTYI